MLCTFTISGQKEATMSQTHVSQSVPSTRALKIGDRVLVHQEAGLRINDDGIERIPHDCSKPEQHWESRILERSVSHRESWEIATSAKRNPNRARWVYAEKSLTLLEGEDWVDTSAFRPGMTITFVLDDGNPHYQNGTVIEARIEAAHIEPGDWYVSFPIPYRDWLFERVVNERNMQVTNEGGPP